ncbi:MAG: FAD-dependent oxidoreductase [Actinomycetota bacterium]|nr:FAD-dependent oxidoreductase [Actinomycetota bacterium]
MTIADTAVPRTQHNGTSAAPPHIQVLFDRCAGCQECIVRCPTGALDLDAETWTIVAHDADCVGCRQCVRTCPFSAITVSGSTLTPARVVTGIRHPVPLIQDRTETRTGIDTWADALAEAARCVQCPDPTCVRGCPTHNDIPGFIGALRHGDLDAAHRILGRTTVLPDVCSRVCDQSLQCEGACTWSLNGGIPVAIGALERFVSDNAPVPSLNVTVNTSPEGVTGVSPMKVAIIGSGPGAIGASAELVGAGCDVTVFERDLEPGGLLKWGIPDFTLPDAIARRPWDSLLESGVHLHLGEDISPERANQLLDSFDALIIAIGASVPVRPPLAGMDLDGVWDATRFLKEARSSLATGDSMSTLRWRTERSNGPGSERAATVLVLGAGNTAMDVARSARRLGADAICVDWMDRRFAPVRPDELQEAADEGVDIRFCTTLLSLEGRDGHVVTARLAATHQSRADERPTVHPETSIDQPVDLVVLAMGYRIDPDFASILGRVPEPKVIPNFPDRHWIASGILANSSPPFARYQNVGRLALGREHGRVAAGLARASRTWVVGDALIGPSTVVEAMAQGKRAAQSILHHSPRRPSRSHSDVQVPARVLLAVESRGGTTASLASDLASLLRETGASTRILPLSTVGMAELTWADVVAVGTWVEGLIVARVGPARATSKWLDDLPNLGDMPVAVFCTYAVSPGSTLASMREAVVRHGGKVIEELAIRRNTVRRPGAVSPLEDFAGALMAAARV